ncbi:MAG: hypothetical protein ACF8XB_19150 [Planctomycetota bacterium JB042]
MSDHLRLTRREVDDILALCEDYHSTLKLVREVREFLLQLGPGEVVECIDGQLEAFADELDASIQSLVARREAAAVTGPTRAAAISANRFLKNVAQSSHRMSEFVLALHIQSIARDRELAVVGECSACHHVSSLAPVEGRYCRACVRERIRDEGELLENGDGADAAS